MRHDVEEKFRALYRNEKLLGIDGLPHSMDGITQIPMELCECLARLHKETRPDLSIESGLAYGFSTLSILDAMYEGSYGHHFAIDPTQNTDWHGVALRSIEELDFRDRFTFVEARSDDTLLQFVAEKKRVQFIFLDGLHLFEAVITDVTLADRLLDIGGLLIINDMWMPAIRSVASYVKRNFSHYDTVHDVDPNIFVVRKTRHDTRSWDNFTGFDGFGAVAGGAQGKQPRGLFSKLFGQKNDQ